MYRVCLVGQDQLLLIILVLILIVLGLIAAIARQTGECRRWRELFRECAADKRELRREIAWLKSCPPGPSD